MTYFDPTVNDDLAYLPVAFRTYSDLERIAGEAESAVIDAYTRYLQPISFATLDGTLPGNTQVLNGGRVYTDLGDGRGVFLRNFTADAAACTDTALLRAMKRTIAGVISWRIQQEQRDTFVTNKAAPGSASVNYVAWHDAPFPRGWDRWLAAWDTREPAWGM